MKCEVGDRIRIKSIDWYNENMDRTGDVTCGNTYFIPEMVKYCGEIVTISSVLPTFEIYRIKEDGGMFNWAEEMIEGPVEKPVLLAPNITEGVYLHEKDMKWTTEYILPDGYIFKDENGNVINATKIVLEKKKKEYPKTYEECCKVLEIPSLGNGAEGYKWEILSVFQNLLICRDAYWKIAGEEMGLGKPWEPDWDNISDKYCIYFVSGYAWSKECQTRQCPFAFPTPEMRDAFKENFDKDLEFCKEFL